MNNQHDIDMQHEIAGLHTANLWAKVALTLLAIVATAALIWMIDYYFGADGVRTFLIVVGIVSIVAIIYFLAIGVSAIFGRQAMAHHNNVLNGLIAFQRADDYGEVARSVATGMTGVIRSENQVEGRLLTLADRMARSQHQLTSAQQRQADADAATTAEANWYTIPATATFDEEIPAGWGN
jgi:hypothetical protein